MNRRSIQAIVPMLWLAIACGGGEGGSQAPDAVAETAGYDLPASKDVGYPDVPSLDVPVVDSTANDPGITPADVAIADSVDPDATVVQDVASDTIADSGCGSGSCTLACPNGFKVGPDGCPICECRPCTDDLQCMKFKTCPTHQTAKCSAGLCGCECSGFVCDLSCPLGFATDDFGCEYCACAKCEYDFQCDVLNCLDPTCRADGVCVCGCEQAKVDYECPDLSMVSHCDCTAIGFACIERPELQCPGVCSPGQTAEWPCPDGQNVPWCACAIDPCVPVCQAIGSFSEGWYDACTGEKIAWSACSACQPVCRAIGSKSEGWYDSCTDKLIRYQSCGPRFDCVDDPEAGCTGSSGICKEGAKTPFVCPDGTSVPFCECTPPDAKCPPVCSHIGTDEEGWFDGCTDKQIRTQKCSGCSATCDQIGSKSEGWYSSCGDLIRYATCGTPQWTCASDPWGACKAGVDCAAEGEGFNLSGGFGMCCPGLKAIDQAGWDGQSCSLMDCLCKVCTQCGDGACNAPENPCNCPGDCGGAIPLGAPCRNSVDCVLGLECLGPFPSSAGGICTQVCTPGVDPAKQCGAGMTCLDVPDHQAPGFCMKSCATDVDCPSFLACGGKGISTGCFPWSWCDPIKGDGCDTGKQCRIANGLPVCGGPGTLPQSYKCDPVKDMCGPGLVCAAGNTCRPVCGDDAFCKTQYMNDLCVKTSSDTPYGYCTTLE